MRVGLFQAQLLLANQRKKKQGIWLMSIDTLSSLFHDTFKNTKIQYNDDFYSTSLLYLETPVTIKFFWKSWTVFRASCSALRFLQRSSKRTIDFFSKRSNISHYFKDHEINLYIKFDQLQLVKGNVEVNENRLVTPQNLRRKGGWIEHTRRNITWQSPAGNQQW